MSNVISGKYRNVKLVCGTLYGFYGLMQSEELGSRINWVNLIDNSTRVSGSFRVIGNSLLGGVLAGTIGALVGATSVKPQYDITCDIYLVSKYRHDRNMEVIRVHTEDKKLIKYLLQFMYEKGGRRFE